VDEGRNGDSDLQTVARNREAGPGRTRETSREGGLYDAIVRLVRPSRQTRRAPGAASTVARGTLPSAAYDRLARGPGVRPVASTTLAAVLPRPL